MKAILLLILLQIISFESYSQLKCKTLKGSKGDSVLCYHLNGKISTIEYYDMQRERYQHFIAFDNKGKEIYKKEHGCWHGCGSLYVKYHENGSLKSARSTFQPDGGIQYYDVTSYFNEDGSFSHEVDMSRNVHEHILVTPKPLEKPKETKTVVETKKVDSLTLILKNASSRKVRILIGRTGSYDSKKVYVLKKNTELEIGKYLPLKDVDDPLKYFEIDIIPAKLKSDQFRLESSTYTTGLKRYVYVFTIQD